MTLRLDDKGGVIAVSSRGKVETLFGEHAAGPSKEEKLLAQYGGRRYEIYVDGQLLFRSRNKVGERLTSMLEEAVKQNVDLNRIKVKDLLTGEVTTPVKGN